MASSPTRSPLSVAIENRLTSEWQPVNPILEQVIPMVPPGRAVRDYEMTKASRERKTGVAQTAVHGMDAKIRYGARQLVNKALNSLKANKRVEVRTIDGVREARLTQREYSLDDLMYIHDRLTIALRGGPRSKGLPTEVLMLESSVRQSLADYLTMAISEHDTKETDADHRP